MRADNWIAIFFEDGKYVGYHCSASCDYKNDADIKKDNEPIFTVATKVEAIVECTEWQCEYGWQFMGENLCPTCGRKKADDD